MSTIIKNWRAWVRSVRAEKTGVKVASLSKGQRLETVRCAANVVNTNYRLDGIDYFVHIHYNYEDNTIKAIGSLASELENYNKDDWKE